MRIIKKYSNRRLYDTEASAYVNLDDLSGLVREGVELRVLDVSSGEDLTRAVLLQVLLEQEGGAGLFPVGLLHRMIRFGGAAPFHKALLGQLATGMELLDAQLTQLERQWGWMKAEAPPAARGPVEPGAPSSASDPPSRPPPATPTAPAPAPDPPDAPAPAAAPSSDDTGDAGDSDLLALRARLAALERRLAGG